MTNKEKMLAGKPYDPCDKKLSSERARARSILREFNSSFGKKTSKRNKLLGKLLGGKGSEIWVEPPFYCDYGSNIFLGEGVYFNFDCTILDPARVVIGEQCLFGPKVQIYTATHPMDPKERTDGKEFAKEISINDNVWVGGGVIILPGITIGSGSVIGAGSVVTKNIPENVLAAGNPCKIIKAL